MPKNGFLKTALLNPYNRTQNTVPLKMYPYTLVGAVLEAV